jgi:hypothetical protein
MPEIRFVALTYNQPSMLKVLYDSTRETYGPLDEDNFLIVNNHSNFVSPGPSRALHDTIRPDYSLGYQSRSWNYGLLHGFYNSEKPACTWVCLVQSDVWFQPGWLEKFRAITADGSVKLVACGPGDQAVFIHIDAFRAVGWFDERLCGNGYQEFDYFFRCYLRLGRACMLQGHGKQLQWNWPSGLELIGRINVGNERRVEEPRPSVTQRVNPMLYNHLERKWGRELMHRTCGDPATMENWTRYLDEAFGSPERPRTNEQQELLPKDYNWWTCMYIDDPRDYSHLYYGYVKLTSSTLFNR